MATIQYLGACGGGNHLRFRVTFTGGRVVDVHRDLPSLRRAVAESSVEDFIVAQIASIARANPNATLVQLRNIIQATEFME